MFLDKWNDAREAIMINHPYFRFRTLNQVHCCSRITVANCTSLFVSLNAWTTRSRVNPISIKRFIFSLEGSKNNVNYSLHSALCGYLMQNPPSWSPVSKPNLCESWNLTITCKIVSPLLVTNIWLWRNILWKPNSSIRQSLSILPICVSY